MKKSSLIIIVCAFGLTMLFDSCKPTEQNYRAAYEAAQNKQQRIKEESDTDSLTLMTDDTPPRKTVGDKSAYVSQEPVTLYGDAEKTAPTFNVAVAKYKMTANAQSHQERLIQKGLQSYLLATPKGEFYVVAASFPTMAEAVTYAAEYKEKNPGLPFAGLPGEPVVIIPLSIR